MAKDRSGSIYVRGSLIYARITYTDATGKRRDHKYRAKSRTHAREIIRHKLGELDRKGVEQFEASRGVSRLTFSDLAEFYLSRYVKEPEYVSERKVAGLRGWEERKRLVEIAHAYFGEKRLAAITYGDLVAFKHIRFKTPVEFRRKSGDKVIVTATRQRSVATVNRELEALRRMLSVAKQEGWITQSPFERGDSLIAKADEAKRGRLLSKEEEARLLAACVEKREHLRAIIICALDTGMRRGEIFKLKWRDVDIEQATIVIQAFNTKTMKERSVGITERLRVELEHMWAVSPKDLDLFVFPVRATVKRSFASACEVAGINGLRFHDLRHTHATRLLNGGMQLASISRMLGHTQVQTTFRYLNPSTDAKEQATEILNRLNEEKEESRDSVVN